MPAVAVIGGAMGVASGVSAIAAGATGFAAIAAGATAVGGALTAVGALTGNKSMQKVGGVLGIGGALGGLATGTLGDPSKVFSGGGTVDTGGSWFDGAAKTATPPVNDSSTGLIGAKSATDSAVTSGMAQANKAAADSIAKTGLNVNDVLDGATINLANSGGASAPMSAFERISNTLSKYDKLANVAGGMADAYQTNQKLNQDQQQFDRKFGLSNQIVQNRMSSGANTTLPISAVPNQGGLIYQGVTPRPLMLNAPNVQVRGVM